MKEDAGHVGVEKYIAGQFSNWASFRPQYMIGSGNNKDCEEWFFDSKNLTNSRSFPIHIDTLSSSQELHIKKKVLL